MNEKEIHLSMYNAALTGVLAANSVNKGGKSIEIVAMEIANRSLTLFNARWKSFDDARPKVTFEIQPYEQI